jgi:hypothetical protein
MIGPGKEANGTARFWWIWNVIGWLIGSKDRSSEGFAQWLQAHPTVETISRDRGSGYIEGATLGAPCAQQIADRWHLLVRRIGACVDSFQRKEGLGAQDP